MQTVLVHRALQLGLTSQL